MTGKIWLQTLKQMSACEEALDWLGGFDSPEEAWQVCKRGDWMLWLLGKLSGPPGSESRKKLGLVCCQCARLSLPYVAGVEIRPLRAIEVAEAWASGEADVSLDDVSNAAKAADYADDATYAAYSTYAASAAYADYADEEDDDAAAYLRLGILRECADIVRAAYKCPELEGG